MHIFIISQTNKKEKKIFRIEWLCRITFVFIAQFDLNLFGGFAILRLQCYINWEREKNQYLLAQNAYMHMQRIFLLWQNIGRDNLSSVEWNEVHRIYRIRKDLLSKWIVYIQRSRLKYRRISLCSYHNYKTVNLIELNWKRERETEKMKWKK